MNLLKSVHQNELIVEDTTLFMNRTKHSCEIKWENTKSPNYMQREQKNELLLKEIIS